ncbi:MAG TPA: dihydroorotase [Woeseiaceae bacterium]|nr:dihydroorotase [Woeseiaceae bacterium]
MTDFLLISNARIVNDGRTVEGDVLVRNGRIEQVAGGIRAPARARVLDAAGRWLLPGMIDDQVHFREPGLTHKGDIATESAAAVAGGVTSFMDMPNVLPQTTTREALAAKYALAAGRARANYAFYLGATNRNLDEIRALEVGEACGIKVFMGASTGDMLVDDAGTLERLFAGAPLLVVTHCEHSPTIRENEARARERFGEDVPMTEHPAIRSAEACYRSSATAVGLAQRHGARLHILHLTTAAEMELLSPGPRREKRVTGEVCVHHLWFDESRYPELGTRIKCNPAIKSAADREALLAAVNDGRLDVIATDHAPHTAEEKAESYFRAPAGLPLVQHVLVALLDLVRAGALSVETVVERTSHAVADIYGVADRGYVREGYHADLVLVDPERPQPVHRDNLLYKCGWSPFEGHTFSASIDTTIVNGRIAWQDGRLTDEIAGQRLAFTRGRD